MNDQFKELEKAFEEIKKKFHEGEISRGEFIDQLKKLRLKDEKGRFWMIGSQSGKWYYFDGNNWIQSEPPSIQEGKAICIYCGFENTIDSALCVRCGQNLLEKEYFCESCGYKLDEPDQDCPNCSKELQNTAKEEEKETEEYFVKEEDLTKETVDDKEGYFIKKERDITKETVDDKEGYFIKREEDLTKETVDDKEGYFIKKEEDLTREEKKEEDEDTDKKVEEVFKDERTANFVFRSLSPLSFLLFWGIIGFLTGIIIGAFAGATDYFYEISKVMPSFLKDFQGKLLGGIIYSIIGGVVGFIAFGVFGSCLTYLINFVLSLVGGIKIRIEKI